MYEYGSKVTVGGHKVLCLQYLDGARDVLRMESASDVALSPDLPVGMSMSAHRYSMLSAAMVLSAAVVERMYHVTAEELQQFVPIECPRLCLTEEGLLRPWDSDTMLSRTQALQLQGLLRQAFWRAVEQYARQYARRHAGERYAQEEMIEAFCRETKTSELYVPALRREWQRRCKRDKR